MKSGKLLKIYLPTLFGILIAAGLVLSYINIRSEAVSRPATITIPTGGTYAGLLDSLASSSSVKSMRRFAVVPEMTGMDKGVRPGRYRLTPGQDYLELSRMFRYGLQSPVKVTFNNIRILPQLAGRVAAQIEPDSLTLVNHLLNDTVPAHYGFSPAGFIGMFIPDTYELYWNTSPKGFTDRMKTEYDRFWSGPRSEKLARTGLSRNEVVTLASIVYEETKKNDEMARVAGVYINRLNIGMPLQADPTAKFAAGDFTIKRVLNIHKDIDSPYNTYKYAGLPPGPICMPSMSAIDAVLDYEDHSFIYFCARADFSGYHDFSKTLAEHERKANIYRAALTRAGIMK